MESPARGRRESYIPAFASPGNEDVRKVDSSLPNDEYERGGQPLRRVADHASGALPSVTFGPLYMCGQRSSVARLSAVYMWQLLNW